MASPIMNLPNELLMNIISYLDLPSKHDSAQVWSKGDVRPTLCALATTCRRVSTLAREFMLRDVKLATGWVSSFHPPYATNRLRKFTRTCLEKPDTINLIRSLEIQADFSATPDWGVSENDKATDLVLQTLSRSLSLLSLKLLLPGPASLHWLPSLFPEYHQGRLFAHLQSFYLDCGNGPISPPLFLYMCGLPSLKHIETPSPIGFAQHPEYLIDMTMRLEPSLTWQNNKSLGVRTIHATGISAQCVRTCELLDKMPKLQELHLSVPGPGVAFDDHDDAHHKIFPPRSTAGRAFSPVEQQIWLNPVANTLRSLSMIDSRVLVFDHDGSRLDLSNFRELQNLELSIHFLCPASLRNARKIAQLRPTQCAPNKDFYQLLPRSLQTLEIHYDSDQGIFYDADHLYKAYHIEDFSEHHFLAARGLKDEILPMMYNELWLDRISNIDGEGCLRDRLEWLLGFRDVRAKVLPKLTALTVRETYAREWAWKDLDLVARYPDVFFDEALKIDVVLRAPKKWEPPVVSLRADDSWKFKS